MMRETHEEQIDGKLFRTQAMLPLSVTQIGDPKMDTNRRLMGTIPQKKRGGGERKNKKGSAEQLLSLL